MRWPTGSRSWRCSVIRWGCRFPIPPSFRATRTASARASGRFVEQNFLEPELLNAKLADVDLARHAADWLKQEGRSTAIANRVTDLLPQLLDAVEDEDVSRFISEQLLARVGEIEAAPLAGEVLGMLTQNDRHQEIMDALLKSASRLLDEYDGMIRQKITENTAWLFRKFALDAVVAKTLLSAAEQQLKEVSEDPVIRGGCASTRRCASS